jgi:micrococcal nuclease
MRKVNVYGIFFIFLFISSFSLGSETTYVAKCISVEDGDTFTVLVNDTSVKIRIFGIDAPEGSQDFGDMAANNLKYLIANKTLLIKEKYKDRYGRAVAEVFLSDKDIGLQMIKSGMAWHFKKYSSDSIYSAAEKEAQNSGIGLWGLSNPIPPWNYRNQNTQEISEKASLRTSLVSSLANEQTSESSTVFITKTGAKYHKDGCSSLRKSKIPKTLSEAINAGYSPCSLCNPPTTSSSRSSLVSSEIDSQSGSKASSSSSSTSYRSSSSGSGQCQAITKKGTRCKRKAKAGSNYCWQHG